MQSPQAQLMQIRRILALWPSQAADDGEELLRAYLLAVEDYTAGDVEIAVDNLVKGVAPGVTPSYRPKPPEVGAECRRVMHLRLDAEHRSRVGRPTLPPPDVVLAPDARQRMAELAKRTAAALRTPDVEAEAAELARKKLGWAKTNARFAPDMSDAAIKRRLGYSAGDPEDDAHAA